MVHCQLLLVASCRYHGILATVLGVRCLSLSEVLIYKRKILVFHVKMLCFKISVLWWNKFYSGNILISNCFSVILWKLYKIKMSYLYMSNVSFVSAAILHFFMKVLTESFMRGITPLSFPVEKAGVKELRMFFHLSPVVTASILFTGSPNSNPKVWNQEINIYISICAVHHVKNATL